MTLLSTSFLTAPAGCAPTRVWTLADVLDSLPNLYSAASAASYESKLRKAGTLLGQRLELVPCDPHLLRATLEACEFAGHFRGATEAAKRRKRDDLINRVVNAAERFLGAQVAPAPGAHSIRAAYDAIETYVRERENTRDEHGVLIFAEMSSLSIANLRRLMGHVAPPDLAAAVIEKTLPTLRGRELDRLRRSIAFFDRLVIGQNRHPEIAGLLPSTPIGAVLRLRAAPIVWSDYPASLKTSFDSALGAIIRGAAEIQSDALAALGEGINPAEVIARARKAKRIRKPEKARQNYAVTLRWLIREAEAAEIIAADEMTDLRVLCRYEVVRPLVEYWKAKAATSAVLKNVDRTSSLHTYLNRIEVVLVRAFGDVRESAKIAILRLTDDAIRNEFVRGMSAEREEFVSYLAATPEAIEALIEAPFALLREAESRLAAWEELGRAERMSALRLYVAAMQFGLQMTRPIRPDNLRRLTIDGPEANVRRPSTGRGHPILRLPASETKNRRRLEHPIPRDVWSIVEGWLDTWRARWIETFGHPDSVFLVPGSSASGALSMASHSAIWNEGAEMIGLPQMTGHMARHGCATIYLAAHPGDFETVASLLGDSAATVREFYGRDSGHEAAARFRAVLEQRYPTLFKEMRI